MPWKLKMSNDDFERIRQDPKLHAALNLARAVNALRFSHHSYLASSEDDTPAGTRHKLQTFFLNCATLYEALQALDRLGQYLSGLDVWQEEIKPLQRSGRYRRFREKVLPHLRDKFVFHFDPDVAPEALETLDLPEYVFAEGVTAKKGDVYFDLADTVALNYLLERLEVYGDSEEVRLESLTRDGAELTVELVDAVEVVLAQAMMEMGWELDGRLDGV